MERKKIDLIWLIASVGSFALMSVSFLLMPLDKTVEIYDTMDIISGVMFYSFLILGITGQIILTLRRQRVLKMDRKKRHQDRKEGIGLISFFKNVPAIIADVGFVISLVTYVVITNVTHGLSHASYILLAVCVFMFCSHCVFNGKIFNYVIEQNKHLSNKERKREMTKVKNSLSSKLLAVLLVTSILIGTIQPTVAKAVENADTLGTIVTLVNGGEIKDDTVTFSDTKLTWSPKNEAIGRNVDGWWVGIQVNAPEGMDSEQLQNSQYKYANSTESKSFWTYKDSADDAESHNIQLWGVLNEEYLINAIANDKTVDYKYEFDWDNDGTYEQPITMSVVPNEITLVKDGVEVYPNYATVTPLTGGTVSGDATNLELVIDEATLNWSDVDESVGRHTAGWWVGMKVTAPVGYTAEELQKAYYNRKVTSSTSDTGWSDATKVDFWSAKDSADTDAVHHIQMWMVINPSLIEKYQGLTRNISTSYEFDWNNDGNTDQTIKLTVVPSDKIVLNKVVPQYDVQYTFSDGQYKEDGGVYYTQGETKATITVDAADFDETNKPVVTVNTESKEPTWTQTAGTDKWVGEITLTGNGDYAIKVTFADKSGNEMDTYEKTVHIDNAAPEFDVTYDNNEARNENNYKADRTATVKVTEHNFKADEVVLTVTAEDINGNPVDITSKAYADYAKNPVNWNTTGDVHTLNTDGMKFDIEAIYSVKLEYTDLAENVAEVYETEFVVDKTDAGNIKIEYSTSVLDEVIEGITFGFYKAPVTVTVTVEDETAGVEYFELTYEKKNGLPGESYVSAVNTDTYTEKLTAVPDETDESVFTAKHTIPAQARGSVSVDVMDKAGNDSAKADKVVVVDDITPVLDAQYTFTDGQYREYNDIYYTQGETKVTFTIDEANFDVASKPVVTVNEENREVTWNQTAGTDEWVGEITLTGNGDYAVKVTFADKSGNVMDTYEKTVHLDNAAPEFDVTYDNNEARNENNYKADRTATVKITEHNFKADEVVLTVTAKDINGNPVDIASKGYADYAKNPANWNTTGDVHALNTDGMKFDIEAIYSVKLEYTDLAENVAEVYETEFVVDKTDAGNIKIEYSTSVLDEVIEGITFGFYKAPVTVTVTAEDETAGVEYFELTYEKKNGLPGESYVSAVNTDTYTEKLTAVPDETDESVFTATHTIPAQARGSISVDVMDKAGNDSDKADEKMLVVDEISPEINVTYAAKDADTVVSYVDANLDDIKTVDEFKKKGHQAYYNGDVVTTIQINEANFFEGKTKVNGEVVEVIHEVGILLIKKFDDAEEITQSTEYLPVGSAQKYPDADNVQYIEWKQEEDVYSFEIPYNEEVDYQLVVEYADFSENNASISADDSNKFEDVKTYTSKIITVDKTAPIVNVAYGNENVKNTVEGRKYFDATQTATITVEEHNFRADDFEATVIAKNVFGEEVSVEDFAQTLRTRENWEKDGNTHTIEIEYPVDANYSFDYKYEDLAQNSAEEYEEDMFTVDTVSPEVVSIEYKEKITDAVINTLTFNYFGANAQVTVTIKDETAGVSKFDYEGLLDSDVSAKNKAVIQTVVEKSEIVQQEGANLFVVKFQIPKEALTELNSFRGTVRVNAYDYSGNTVQKHDATHIVVDKIAPTCQVTFDQPVKEVNGVSYYDKAFTATIVIDEANFYAEDVVINVNGARVMPTDWTQTPGTDIWTSHVSFTVENDYVMAVNYTDRSGNVMTVYESNQKTLDTTEPVITVSNIKHESANNDETIGFTLTITDKNMALENVQPTVTAVVRRGENSANYTYDRIKIDLGQPVVSTNDKGETVYIYTVSNLEIDGYYSLECTVVDHANHSVSDIASVGTNNHTVAVDVVNFSVNRGGSVFWIETVHNDKYTDTTFNNELNGAFANDKVTVKLHEVNVDLVDELEEEDKRTVLTLNDGSDSKSVELVEKNNGSGNYDRNVAVGVGGWYETIYTLENDQFAKDGTYSLNIITYDKAENSNVNTKNEEGTIKFVVDRTNPVVTTNVKSGQIIDASKYTVEFTIAEVNLDESTIVVKVEGKEQTYEKVSSNTFEFEVEELLNDKFTIEVKDLAGNSAEEYKIDDLTVSAKWYVRWFANKPLFWGTVGGAVALTGLFIFFIVWKRRKKDEEEA